MAKSALIGRIAVDLVANTGKLLAPLKQAEGAIASVANRARGFGSIMARIVAPITAMAGSILSVYYAINKLKQAFATMEDTGKAADRFGVTTERLIGLQHAAKLADIGMEELHNALFQMLRRGYNVDQLEKMADQFLAIEDPAARAAFVLKRFGKQGQFMMNMLQEGSAGLQAMQREAERLGLTFSRLDASKVDLAGDAITKIKESLDAVWNRLAVALAPWLNWLANKLLECGTNGRNMGFSIIDAFDVMVKGITPVLDVLHDMNLLLKQSALGWQTIATWAAEAWYQSLRAIPGARNERAYSKQLAQDLWMRWAESARAFEEAVAAPIPSERLDAFFENLRNQLLGIQQEFESLAEHNIPKFPGRGAEFGRPDDNLSVAALERGSQAAFKAIFDTTKMTSLEQQQLDAQKRQTAVLERLERRGVMIFEAGLAGGL